MPDFLKRKVGPFQLWVWGLLLVGGLVLGIVLRRIGSNSATAPVGEGDSLSGSGFPPHTGTGAADIPQDGYLATTPSYDTPFFEDAFGFLADSFNQYSDQLAAQQDAIQNQLDTYFASQDSLVTSDALRTTDAVVATSSQVNQPTTTTTVVKTSTPTSSPTSSPTKLQAWQICEMNGGVMFRGECLTQAEYETRLRELQKKAAADALASYQPPTYVDPTPTGYEASVTQNAEFLGYTDYNRPVYAGTNVGGNTALTVN